MDRPKNKTELKAKGDAYIRESLIERYLVNEVARIGGKAYKWTSPGTTGVPDRLCLLPQGVVLMCEIKTQRGALKPVQMVQHDILGRLGHKVHIIRKTDDVDALLNKYRGYTSTTQGINSPNVEDYL